MNCLALEMLAIFCVCTIVKLTVFQVGSLPCLVRAVWTRSECWSLNPGGWTSRLTIQDSVMVGFRNGNIVSPKKTIPISMVSRGSHPWNGKGGDFCCECLTRKAINHCWQSPWLAHSTTLLSILHQLLGWMGPSGVQRGLPVWNKAGEHLVP